MMMLQGMREMVLEDEGWGFLACCGVCPEDGLGRAESGGADELLRRVRRADGGAEVDEAHLRPPRAAGGGEQHEHR
jgi:hypothetical protein